MHVVLFSVEVAIFAFFLASAAYVFFFSFFGLFYKRKSSSINQNTFKRFAILIPAYKEDAVILSVADSMLQIDYPSDFYDVYIIADHMQPETLVALRGKDVELVEVKFESSTKTKSLNFCLDSMDTSKYDMVVISDADNIFAKDFLAIVNDYAQMGYSSIQGRRVAKNSNTDLAVLDGASEAINNHIFRKGPNAIGLSASLIGSGMAFQIDEVVSCLKEIKAIGGFDKVLQLKIIERGNRILYLDHALVYDEKTDSIDNFKNQRRRWLSSQYKYLLKYLGQGSLNLIKGRFDYFNIAVLHNLFLPRVINLGCLFLLSLMTYLLSDFLQLPYWYWSGTFLLYVVAMLMAMPRRMFGKKLFRSMLSLPQTFWSMFLLLFKLKGADKKFIHTQHSQVEVDEDVVNSK
ncbi:glycosyltransferase [Reichenbachiella ulvae]|uniref:Glycosyltransferase family 2 protein n=1 Tax=Reichenbachiella ulvae TaxID=2980104 RepID=A0ABT3CN79_9BACT|nr:glycosyltransferase family 2 protein [Reichenbachiella ulvae]MCV9385027.1 glycosyltransferase family 2 protein [Reichenbachiella ulvae]